LHDLVTGYDNTSSNVNYDEGSEQAAIDIQSNTTLAVANTDGKRMFNCTYDHVLGPTSTQEELYGIVNKCTSSVIEGFNATIFAYGQTGSGKTFSMYGPPNEFGNRSMQQDRSLIGVIPRAVQEIFDLSEQQDVMQVSVYVSFVQIYNEQLFDMLRDASMVSPLTIREDQGREIYVQGLSEYNVKSVNDTLQLLKIAEDNRTVRETHMNQFSSRSHSIFQIYVEQKRVSEDGGEVYLRAKYNLVDLAGSEKWNLNKYMRDEHVTEMTNINLSLHTLGRCISSLAQRSLGKDLHVPFRDSKLTRLLQDSLGGNARTYLLATVSPLKANVEETISTLKFADNAKRVMVQAVMNETRPIDHAMVKRLQTEVERLRGLLRMAGLDLGGNPVGPGESSVSQELVQHQNSVASSAGAPVMTSQQPMAVGNLAGINLLTSLEGALQTEQEKVGKFRGENERLQKEVKRLMTAGGGSGGGGGGGETAKMLMKENIIIPIIAANDAAAAINTVFQSHQLIWAEVNRMKQTVKKVSRVCVCVCVCKCMRVCVRCIEVRHI
jgi:kinesin family protein 3/17